MAELADAQPSGGCARKGVEVRLLSSAPTETNVKHWFTGGIFAALLATTATAGLLDPVDPNRVVEANSRVINTQTLNMKNVSAPVLQKGWASESNRFVPTKGVETKRVELGTYETKTLDKPVVPQANFTTKRSDSSDKNYRTETAKTGTAPINPRKIRPFTPQGEKELNDQLRRRDW